MKEPCHNISHVLFFQLVVFAFILVDANVLESSHDAVHLKTSLTESINKGFVVPVIATVN